MYYITVIHNHQPYGNFEWVVEDAFKKGYAPFIDVLEKHPKIKVALHFSGWLMEWIEANHGDYIDKIKELVQKGQVEILTGAYYEAIVPVIPPRDAIAQIKHYTQYLKRLFGVEPKGMWVAERVWEPHAAEILAEAGVKYVFLDDWHFLYAGLKNIHTPYITEHLGKSIIAFPIDKRTRYLIPYKDITDVLGYLKMSGKDDIVVYGDDGEKFGVWPNTYEHVYEKRWLDAYFSALERDPQIQIMLPSEVLERVSPRGPVYLPTAAYPEMMIWALPTESRKEYEAMVAFLEELGDEGEAIKKFLRGTLWRSFLAKYPESNRMYKKLLYVSDKVAKASQKKHDERMLKALWRGETNCPFWHGVFGGLYLGFLRDAIYKSLIEAENMADEILGTGTKTVVRDFLCNGHEQILVETPTLNVYIDPYDGGNVFELDVRKKHINLINTLTRREEAYHKYVLQKPSEEEGLKTLEETLKARDSDLGQFLVKDWYMRTMFRDHFFHPDTTLWGVARANYGEQGDFTIMPFSAKIMNGNGPGVELVRDGHVWIGPEWHPVKLTKRIIIQGDSTLKAEYTIKNMGGMAEFWFGTDLAYYVWPSKENACIVNGTKNEITAFGEDFNVRDFLIVDKTRITIEVSFDKPAMLYRFPIYTVSRSESGLEKTYQHFTVIPSWKMRLGAEEEWRVSIIQKIY